MGGKSANAALAMVAAITIAATALIVELVREAEKRHTRQSRLKLINAQPGALSMERTFKTWEKTECDNCGQEYQVTRTKPKTLNRCICGECETYERAYRDGLLHGLRLGSIGWRTKQI
jgi:hypothetical protein